MARTFVKVFRPYPPRGRSRAGQKYVMGVLPTFSDQKATATNQMHCNDVEACGMKCCYFLFQIFSRIHCTLVSDSGPLGLLFRFILLFVVYMFLSYIPTLFTT